MYRELASAREKNLSVAKQISEQVICLPMYPNLDDAAVERIIGLMRDQAPIR
jgi:dTDP-4-amino-4,6-dideoxygalactose transaminase